MVRSCCVLQCLNRDRRNSNISFYKFPKVNERYSKEYQELVKKQRKAWFTALNRKMFNDSKNSSLLICSDHFETGKPADFRNINHPDWYPQVKMGYKPNGISIQTKMEKYERNNRRNALKVSIQNESYNDEIERCDEVHCIDQDERADEVETHTECNLEDPSASNITQDVGTNDQRNTQTQTDVSLALIAAMEAELHAKSEEIYRLRQKVARMSLKRESFENNDVKVKHYTGLPSFALLDLILRQVDEALCNIRIKNMNSFQKLMLTLMKLTNNNTFRGLSYRFDITIAEASLCFKNVILILEYAFRAVIHWPERDCLRTTMPRTFQEAFGHSVVVIIDCFEINIQRPANIKARALCFSNYKHNYTVKYLIGITPQGFVSYISDGWGGRTTDKHITENSDFLSNLLPGDVVLSDRGFTVKDAVGMQYAKLITPEFMRNKSQLSPEAVQETRKVASVRIHVERVIGLVRNKYKILKGPIPINFLKFKQHDKCLLDYVVRTTCILTNLCDGIVPLERPEKQNDHITIAANPDLFTDKFEYCT